MGCGGTLAARVWKNRCSLWKWGVLTHQSNWKLSEFHSFLPEASGNGSPPAWPILQLVRNSPSRSIFDPSEAVQGWANACLTMATTYVQSWDTSFVESQWLQLGPSVSADENVMEHSDRGSRSRLPLRPLVYPALSQSAATIDLVNSYNQTGTPAWLRRRLALADSGIGGLWLRNETNVNLVLEVKVWSCRLQSG